MTTILYVVVLIQSIETISSMWGIIGAVVVLIGAVMWDAMAYTFLEEIL